MSCHVAMVAAEPEATQNTNPAIANVGEANAAMQAVDDPIINEEILEHAKMEQTLAQTKVNSLTLELKEADQTIVRIKNTLKELDTKLQDAKLTSSERNNGSFLVAELTANLSYYHSLLALEQTRWDVLNKALKLAEQNLIKVNEQKTKLLADYRLQQQQEQRKSLEQLAYHLQIQQKKWLEKLTAYNQQLQTLTTSGSDLEQTRQAGEELLKQKQLLETHILEAEEKSSINHFNLVLAELKNQSDNLDKSSSSASSIAELNMASNNVDVALHQINGIKDLLSSKLDTLRKRLAISQHVGTDQVAAIPADFNSMVKGFIGTYQAQYNAFNNLQQQFVNYQKNLRQELGRALAKRQELPGFNWSDWRVFLAKLWVLPELIWQSGQSVAQRFIHIASSYTWWHWLLLTGYEVLLLGLWKIGRFYLKKLYLALYHEQEPLAKNALYVLLKLLRRNLLGLVVCFNIFSLLAINHFSFQRYALFFSFALVWFGYRFALGLARLTLLETIRDAGGKDAKLYHRLKWLVSVGAILIALLVVARQLPVDYSVNDFINRLFMLQLLLVSMVMLPNWEVLPALLSPYLENKRIYFGRAIHWLSLSMPVALLVNAIVGLVGYVQLAWTMSAYQGVFLLVVLGYLIVRGLVIDLMDWFASSYVLNLPNGWLWGEAFLKPLDKLLRLCLFFSMGYLLFYLYGWDQNSFLVHMIKKAANYPLMQFDNGDPPITAISILSSVVVILILSWIARWSREFSYRWLYAYHKDLGIRNSLSVFTQYLTVIVCVYIALRFSGRDFTGLNYILGGVSFGAGLGLRDLVNNFASGILLLIERPIKKGDIVTIGPYEGEVTHIGMRAMTIRTWDHMEVLVPNSEAFSKSFTNWTHEDLIIRTVLPLKVQRVDNPHLIKSIILEVLSEMKDVLSEPGPNVYMKALSEPLLEFEVRYFINIQQSGSRSRVRSDVLYAIWQKFTERGIKPPVPLQEVQLSFDSTQALKGIQP
jgi:potassium efflux system protein